MKRRIKVNWGRFLAFIFAVVLFGTFICYTVDCYKYPEKYFTTWRYQLKHKIRQGDEKAIEYYNRVYVANGVKLFED